MLMLRIFRAFAAVRNSAMIPNALKKSRYSGNVLNVFETQSNHFDMNEHGGLLLKTLLRTNQTAKSQPESEQNKPLDKILEDGRFDKFLKILNEKDANILIYLDLAWVYHFAHQKFEAATLERLIERVKRDTPNLSNCSVALKIIALAGKRDSDTIEFANELVKQIIKLLETEIPDVTTVKNLLSLDLWKKELSDNLELLTILEPYVLKYADEIGQRVLVHTFGVYSHTKKGSNEFIKQLLFQICVKVKDLQANEIVSVIDNCAYVWRDILDDTEHTLKLLYQEVLKKLGSLNKSSVLSMFRALNFSGIGNPHYYELLSAQWVKVIDQCEENEMSKLTFAAAEGNLSSKTLIKALNRVLKPIVVNVSPLIYDIYDTKVQTPIGLIEGKDDFELQLSKIKQDILKSIKPAPKDENMTISNIYKTNEHPFFDFEIFVQFMWGLVKIADLTDIKMLDSETWNLLVQLLKKHVSEIDRNDKKISYGIYDMLSQIAFLSNNAFQTISKIIIPRDLTDYSQHSDYKPYTIANSNSSKTNEEFENQFAEFCKENSIKYHLPITHSAENSSKELLVGNVPFYVNAKAKNHVIVLRELDLFSDGYIRGLMKHKLKLVSSITPLSVVRYDGWVSENMSKDYFKKIL